MGQHYLPKRYLAGFAEAGRIWTYDKSQRRWFESQPKSVANETGMYGDEAETFLATQVEDPALPALTAVRSYQPISSDHRLALVRYIVALWRRVPKARDRVRQLIPTQAEETRADLHARLDFMQKLDGIPAEVIALRHQTVDEIVDQIASDAGEEIWRKLLTKHQSPNVEKTLFGMNWVFLVSRRGQFVTGDNPVFFFEDEGIAGPQSELTIPLSANVALWASHQPRKCGDFDEARPSEIKEINRRTASQISRYMFSRAHEPWIMQVLSKNTLNLGRLRR